MTETWKLLVPDEVWVSVDGRHFDWSKAGWCRVGIGEGVFSIPNCWATLSTDYEILEQYVLHLDSKIVVLKKCSHINYQFQNELTWCNNIKDKSNDSLIALQLLQVMGAKKVHMVGYNIEDTGFITKVSKINVVPVWHTQQ